MTVDFVNKSCYQTLSMDIKEGLDNLNSPERQFDCPKNLIDFTDNGGTL